MPAPLNDASAADCRSAILATAVVPWTGANVVTVELASGVPPISWTDIHCTVRPAP